MINLNSAQYFLNKNKQIVLILFVTVFLFGITGCGNNEPETITIGFINLTPVLEPIFEGFKEGMAEAGYIEGENVTYIYNGPTGNIPDLDPAAEALIEANVDLIFSLSTPATQAAQRATADNNIPVVFVPVTDPIAAGVVESLKEPGGNITGVTIGLQEERQLEWLLRSDPSIKVIYIPYNPEDNSPVRALVTVQEAAKKLDVEIVTREARNPEEVAAAADNIPEEADAVLLLPDSVVATGILGFIESTRAQKLPLADASPLNVKNGALLSYSFGFPESGKQAARLADQILQGEDPAFIPVETAEFLLTINLETAEVIGLEISDEVLEAASTIIR